MSEAQRLLFDRLRPTEAGCLEWTGGSTHGYGCVHFQGKVWRAHRLAWTLQHGPIADGMMVLHRCDNPPCCNHEHLFLGDQTTNMQDCSAKGRTSRRPLPGEANGHAKITENQVRMMRYWRGKVKASDWAHLFAVTPTNIYDILAGRTWKHLPL